MLICRIMDLKTYCKVENIKFNELARKLGLSAPFITQIIKGDRRPSPEIAQKIEEKTGGQVTRMELLYPNEDFENEKDADAQAST